MKAAITALTIFTLFSSPAFAMEAAQCPPTPKASADLERIKLFEGKWAGTTAHADGKSEPAAVEYHVTSGGSAVVETLCPGTPNEMVSVYHDKAGKLSMTHYCMLGNQPEMDLVNIAGGKMQFDMSQESHKSLEGQMHMHSLVLDTSAQGQIIQTWTAVGPDGKPMDSTVMTLRKAA